MNSGNFWDQTHPLSKVGSELFEKLIPSEGNCESLQGELLRCANKISYDWYNNGWGCNNWSGAVQFIRRHFRSLPIKCSEDEYTRLLTALYEVKAYSHGEPVDCDDEEFNKTADEWVTTIEEIVVQSIVDNPELIFNTRDMFDYQETDYKPPRDDWYLRIS